jgi:PAS domain S-box-containing protein
MFDLFSGQDSSGMNPLATSEQPPETRLSWLVRYLLAIIIAFIALSVDLLFVGLFQANYYIPFFVAVGVSAWYCGTWPALVTALLAIVLGEFLANPGDGQITFDQADFLRVLTFIILVLLINLPNIRRRRSEEILREQREWFRVCLSGIGDAVIATDSQERIVFMNPVAETLTGWEQQQAIGKPVEQIFHIINEQTRQPVQHPVSRALAEGRIIGLANRTLLIDRSGGEKPIDDSGAPIRDSRGEIIGAVIIFRDISERKQFERNLQESEARFRLLAENARDMVSRYRLTEPRGYEYVSPSALEMMGYTPEEVMADSQFDLNTVYPEDKPILQALLDDLEGYENKIIAHRRIRKDGRIIWAEFRYGIQRGEDGTPVAVESIARDITERKEAEDTQRYLSEASRILASSLEYETTLKNIARLAVPTIADWCAISILDEGGELHELALAHRDPAMEKLVEEIRDKYPPKPDDPNILMDVARTKQPYIIPEVSEEMLRATTTDEHLLDLLRRLQLKSALYVPIISREQVLGVLALSSGDSGRSFGEEYIPLAEELARRAAVAIDNARLYEAAQREIEQRTLAEAELAESEAQLRLVTDALPVLISYVDKDGCYQFNNKAYESWFKESRESIQGKHMRDLLGDAAYELLIPHVEAVLSGQTVRFEQHLPYRMAGERDMEGTYVPDINAAGEVEGFFVLMSDITERKRAEQTRDFLAEASRLLASSLDYQTTLKNIAGMAVPNMCDWCTIDILDENHNLQQLVTNHADPDKHPLIEAFRQAYASTTRPSSLTQQIARSNQPILIPEVTDEWLHEMIPEEHAYDLIKQLNLKSILSVPIMLRGENLGVLNFRFSESGRVFTQEDLKTAEELARSAAVAIENARLYQAAQREIEQRKQAERRTNALYRIARGFSEAVTSQEIAGQLNSQGLESFGMSAGVIGLLDEQDSAIEIISFHQVLDEVRANYQTIPLDADTAISEAVRTREPVWLPTLEAYAERYPRHADMAERQGAKAALGLPLIVEGRVIGGMSLQFNTPQPFPEEDRDFWLTVAQQTAQALDRARLYQETHEAREWLEVTLSGIGDAVIATDTDQKVTFLNPIAAGLTGWTMDDALGKPVTEVFHIVKEDTRQPVENPVEKVLREGRIIGVANHTILISRNGMEFPVDDSGAPIRNHRGELIGAVLVFRDITERRRAEAQLRESEARFRAMAETVPDVLYTSRADGSPDYISQRFYEFTGIPVEQALTDGGLSALHPDDIEQNRPRLLESREFGTPFEGQYRFRMVDGSYRWFVTRNRPVHDENGRIIKWVGSSTDIHDMKQTQEELVRLTNMLEQGRQRLKNILANVPGVVWEAWGQPDLGNQRIDFVSDYVERMLGYSVDEWLNTPNFWLSIVHPEDRERASAEASAIFTSGKTGISRFRWMTKDGRAIPVEAQSSVITDINGTPVGMRGVTMDISEREQAERERMMLFQAQQIAIRQKEEAFALLDALFSSAPIGLAFFDTELRFQRINQALADITGFPPEDHISHTPRELLPDVSVEGTETMFLKVLETGEAHTFETSGMTPAAPGEIRHWFASYYPIRLQDEILGVGALVLDITERKRMEQQLGELLERERAAREAAEEADRLKLTFLAMISHELRTPLTSIKGFATTLLADDISWDAESQRDFITIISEEADKLTDLIEQLLDLSRLEAGTLGIAPEVLYLPEIVGSSMAQLETITASHDLHIDIAEGLPPLKADLRRTGQVIVNLVNNAAKYSPPETEIRISAQPDGDFLQINVTDRGPGIPSEDRELVFEAFRQVESRGANYKKGAGLGLAICKGLVEAHGGRIWLQDTDSGTTISFTLPIAGEQ